MADASRPHLVILVHGIRDIARWQSEVGHALESAGLIVEHTSYGRMNLIAFLLPIDYFRARAVERVWTDIQHARMLHPEADVSIVAHSFGTYVVTRILKAQFALHLKRLVLCGAVVRYDFPFEQIQNRFAPPLVNEVGTADPWPAIGEAVTFGYGSAGTFGFNRPGVRDRFHNHRGHGYFLDAGFASRYWVPFLRDGELVEADVKGAPPPLPVRLVSIFKLKWLFLAIAVLLLLFALLRGLYGADPVAARLQGGVVGWHLLETQQREAARACPLPLGLCNVPGLAQLITERRYVRVSTQGGSLATTASCAEFRFPPPDAPVSRDPVALLEHLGATFPQCVDVGIDARANMTIRFLPQNMTEVRPAGSGSPVWLCGCTAEQVAAFAATD